MKMGEIEGIIMCKDYELCYFHYKDSFVEYEPIGICPDYTPFEFITGYTAKNVIDWLFDRLPEDGRQGLVTLCQYYGIRMIGADILKFNNGRVIDDPCWIKFKTGPQTYQEVLDAKYK